MPSLREYVLTLKKYNPNAQDRILKIYLLKAGWPIADIEKIFAEVNAPKPVIADIVTVVPPPIVQTLTPVVTPTPLVAVPKVEAVFPKSATTTIEVAAPEIQIEPQPKPQPVPQPQVSLRPEVQPQEIIAAIAPVPTVTMPAIAVPVPVPAVENPPIIDGSIHESMLESATFNGGNQITTPSVSSIEILSAMAAGSAVKIGDHVTETMPAPKMSDIERDLAGPRPAFSIPIPIMTPTPTAVANADTKMQPFPSADIVPRPAGGKKAAKILLVWLFILIFLGVLGFGYKRYVHGIYLFVSAPIAKENVLSYIAESFFNIDTAEYTTHLTLEMMPREPGVESFNTDVLGQRTVVQTSTLVDTASSSATSTVMVASDDSDEDILAAFSADAKIDMQIQGFYQKEKNNEAEQNDGRWHFKGDYSGEGITAKIDVESIVKDGMTYIKAADFPEMFFDINAIKDKWVSIADSDTESVRSALPWLEMFSMDKDEVSQTMESTDAQSFGFRIFDVPTPQPVTMDKQLARLISIAGEEKVLEVIGEPRKVIQQGSVWFMPKKVAYEYQVQPNLEQFIAFIERSNTILQAEFGASSILVLTPEKRQEIKSKEFASFFNYFVRNGYFKMTVDKDKVLLGIDTSLKLVSEDKQALVSASISFDNINESVSIDAPKAEMNFTDAYVRISGKSKELLLLKSQAKTVEAIRASIRAYQNTHAGEVPDMLDSTLQDLSLPNLTFATSSYAYKKVSKTSYLLSYQIVLPPLPAQFYELPLSLIGFDASTAASSGTDLSMQYLKFVNGKNTASEKSMSIEAEASKRLDSDRDRITNGLEQYIGTNITKKDTDEDGVDDYEELQKGGNPTGPGSWVGSPK